MLFFLFESRMKRIIRLRQHSRHKCKGQSLFRSAPVQLTSPAALRRSRTGRVRLERRRQRRPRRHQASTDGTAQTSCPLPVTSDREPPNSTRRECFRITDVEMVTSPQTRTESFRKVALLTPIIFRFISRYSYPVVSFWRWSLSVLLHITKPFRASRMPLSH